MHNATHCVALTPPSHRPCAAIASPLHRRRTSPSRHRRTLPSRCVSPVLCVAPHPCCCRAAYFPHRLSHSLSRRVLRGVVCACRLSPAFPPCCVCLLSIAHLLPVPYGLSRHVLRGVVCTCRVMRAHSLSRSLLRRRVAVAGATVLSQLVTPPPLLLLSLLRHRGPCIEV
jgi:hypothetical protein